MLKFTPWGPSSILAKEEKICQLFYMTLARTPDFVQNGKDFVDISIFQSLFVFSIEVFMQEKWKLNLYFKNCSMNYLKINAM